MNALFTRRAALGCAVASIPAIAVSVALPMPMAEQEIARHIAAYREAERNYNQEADAYKGQPFDKVREARVNAAFAVWSGVFRELLAAPCRSFRAVQMKAEVLLSDETGAFGQGMEYHETELLLRSFMAVQS